MTIQLSVYYLVECHVDKDCLHVARGYELLLYHSQRLSKHKNLSDQISND